MSRKKYKYRFKTEQEFIDSYGENWKDVINGNWVGSRTRIRSSGWENYGRYYYGRYHYNEYNYVDKGMDKFFGKKFQITKKERIEKLERGEKLIYHYSFSIHKDMLVCLFVPSYKPKRIIRKI